MLYARVRPQEAEPSRERDAPPRRTHRSSRVVVAVMLGAAFAHRVYGAGQQTTACVNLCPDLGDPCVVNQNVTVVAGSNIECGTRAVVVSGGDLLVHDGRFALRARSLEINSAHTLTADCPQLSSNLGFTIQVTEGITIGVGASMRANCDAGGGIVTLDAGGPVNVGGLGIQANGTAQNGPGGRIGIRTTGAVTTTTQLKATTTNTGDAAGGYVEIFASAITIGDYVYAGAVGNERGGTIALNADGDITINAIMDVVTSMGDGGDMAIRAGGTLHTTRPLRARGLGSTSVGGAVDIEARRVLIDNDITAMGGIRGGGIHLQSRGGTMEIGSGATAAVTLDVSIAGANAGPGGDIEVQSTGNDVVIGSLARLYATDGGQGGDGGVLSIAGATVTVASGSQLFADGRGNPGTITIQSRDQMTLSGTMHATTNGSQRFVYRQTAPSIGSGITGPYTVDQDSTLLPPCGDAIRRDGVEDCDGLDLGGKACGDVGFTSGTLRCSSTCTYDTTDCTN